MDDLSNFNCPQYVDFLAGDNHVFKAEEETLDLNPFLGDDQDIAAECAVVQTKDSGIDCADSMEKKDHYGLAASPSCSSDKDVKENENLDTEDESSYNLHINDSHPEMSESCLGNSSYLESIDCVTPASCQADDFPVMRPKNLSLPENASKKASKKNKAVGKAFHYMESMKRKREDEHIPLAEQVIAFHKKTPQRFHTTGSKVFEPTQHWCPSLVNPKSPKLRAVKRMRGTDVLSREEQEEKEVEEIKGYKFHAHPVNENILHRPQLVKVKKKTPTKPRDFHLKTAQRAAEVNARKKVEEPSFEFHARPVPKAIFKGPTGIKEKISLPVTEPKTPNFALKSRAEKWKSEDKLNSTTLENQRFKALPVPAPTVPFVPKHEKKRTEIQPFSFDVKDKERFAKKEEKIMKEIEKENAVFVFKAQGIPSLAPCPLPAVEKKPPTLPQPFNFEGRSSKHNSLNSTSDQICPVFKAQPATVLEKPPFIPEKSAKQPVEVKEFHLYTDIRASERQKLKEINDLKEREKERLLEQLKRLEEEEERKEIERLRKEAVHKANPIRHYKPVEIKPSDKGLTVPVSPKFKTEERLHRKH